MQFAVQQTLIHKEERKQCVTRGIKTMVKHESLVSLADVVEFVLW